MCACTHFFFEFYLKKMNFFSFNAKKSTLIYNAYMNLEDKQLHFSKSRLEALQKLGLTTIEDILSYYPMRFDCINTKDFSSWKIKEKVVFEAKVISHVSTFRKGKFTSSRFDVIMDDNVLHITIFNRPWISNIRLEQIMTITGTYMGNQKVTAINYDNKRLKDHDFITPVYATKEGVQQRTIRDSIKKVFETVENELIDYVPEEMIQKYKLLRRREALFRIHFPENEKDVLIAKRTLKYEEFLRFFIAMQTNKNEEGFHAYKSPKHFDMQKIKTCIKTLPFSLTKDQITTLQQIFQDLSSTHPMYRLVQGDVGCGKTVIAAISMYACFLSGNQSALLAPTEILAKQHLQSLKSIIQDSSCRIEVLYSGLSTKEKQKIFHDLKQGDIHIIIGTHALLQEDVQFQKLGYVVADEQQRFGVQQRKTLRLKGNHPDFLLMSATPIPRTLASAFFGDMEVSSIHSLPTGRKPPITTLIQENSFRSVLDDVNALLTSGRQLYVICAAVEENEDYKARDVIQMKENLSKLFQKYKVGMLHGRMHSIEKQQVMQEFYENTIQILVSTTVVEVGMNVVNATGMIIYDADRFGLSQLHQLRGRIQRGNAIGHCWLLTANQNNEVIQRLQVLTKSNDGFEIAEADLRLRGPGDILGTRQSGLPDFILGNLYEDTRIIETTKKDAEMIVQHPDNPDYMKILESVKQSQDRSLYVD